MIRKKKKKKPHKTSFGDNKIRYAEAVLPGNSDTARTIDPNDTAGDVYLRTVIGYFDMLIQLTKDDKYELSEWYSTTSYYGKLLEKLRLRPHVLKSFLELLVDKNARHSRPIDLIRKIGTTLQSDGFNALLAQVYNNYAQQLTKEKEKNSEYKKTLDGIKKLLEEFAQQNLLYKNLIKSGKTDENEIKKIRTAGAEIRLGLVKLWESRENKDCDQKFSNEAFHNQKSLVYITNDLPWGDNYGIAMLLTPGTGDTLVCCLKNYPLGNAVLQPSGNGFRASKAWICKGDQPDLTADEDDFLHELTRINRDYVNAIYGKN